MPEVKEIRYFNRYNSCLETEDIYGGAVMKWLYQSTSGKCLSALLCRRFVSQIFGAMQNTTRSRRKINAFIHNYDIQMDEYLPAEGGTLEIPYSTFNQFFIRRFKSGKRPFNTKPNILPAFAEGRYLGYEQVRSDQVFSIKGSDLSVELILNNEKWFRVFDGGPLVICRLCPVDYHRFHYPDDGILTAFYRETGKFHSVNPIALANKKHILDTNERVVSILETKNFGKLAFIEVGAMCVGKIVQTFDNSQPFKRGDEKGYFLFGGSTVIILGEPGKWKPEMDILKNTNEDIETYIKLGDTVGGN